MGSFRPIEMTHVQKQQGRKPRAPGQPHVEGRERREVQETSFTQGMQEGCMEEGADGQSVLLLRPDTASPLEGHTTTQPKISTHALSTGAAQESHPRDRGQPPPWGPDKALT